MHCVSSYPTQAKNVNLPRMKKLNEIHSHVGYSGHLKALMMQLPRCTSILLS